MLVSGAVGMVEYCSCLSNGDALSAATGDGLHLGASSVCGRGQD